MKTIAVLALLAFSPVCPAQTQPDIKLAPNVRMYQPKNITPDKGPRVARSVQSLSNALTTWDDVPHAFIIRGNPQEMDMAEALLKRFDVPDPRVELTIYLVRASATSPGSNVSQSGYFGAQPAENSVPADLKSAIDEMKSTFNYTRYTLWDQILVQPAANGGELQGILPAEAGSYVYAVNYAVPGGSPLSEGKTLNLSGFTFSLKMPSNLRPRAAMIAGNPPEAFESHIRTDVTVREGQKLVLGKIRLLPAGSGDLFLVLATKVY
jgi:hypothetical protein